MTAHAIHTRFVETAGGLSPALVAALERAGPQRMRSRADMPFALYLCRAIIGQQLSTTAARTIWGRVEACAEDRPVLDCVCKNNAEALRACGMSAAKAKAIIAIAETARAGGLDTDALRAMNYAERSAALTAIWGVGQWTADMASMFYFGDEDVWPDGDVAARKTLERLTSRRRKTIRTAARFAPHRSWLALYMWAHADAPPIE